MAADESNNFSFLALGHGGENIPDGKLSQPDDGVANFFPRRIGNTYLSRGIFQENSGKICCDQSAAYFCHEAAAGNFLFC